MTTKVIFWDFDGLMVDSERCAFDAWRSILRDLEVELTLEAYRPLVGLHDTTAGVQRLLYSHGRDVPEEALRAQFRARYRDVGAVVPLMPGVVNLLERTTSLGLVNWIVSSSTASLIHRHLARLHLDEYFVGVVSSESTSYRKPSPDPYLFALAACGEDADDVRVLEDSRTGVDAARAAGLTVAFIPSRVTVGQEVPPDVATFTSVAALDDQWLLA